MRGPTVAISEICRQTLIAVVALFSCAVTFTLTAVYFALIDSGTMKWLMIGVGSILEVAKICFALTGAHDWRENRWIKSGLFWILSGILSVGSVIAAHGVVTHVDNQTVSQKAMMSVDYQRLQGDADRLRDRMDTLTSSVKEDMRQNMRSRALQTEDRIDAIQRDYDAIVQKMKQKSSIATDSSSDDTHQFWRQTWRLIVAILLEVIGQVAMLEMMTSKRVLPLTQRYAVRSTFHSEPPNDAPPKPDSRLLRLVPKGKKSLTSKALRLRPEKLSVAQNRHATSKEKDVSPLYAEAKKLMLENHLPPTHVALMESLGCSRSSAQRILKRMRLDGLVKLSGNRNVRAA